MMSHPCLRAARVQQRFGAPFPLIQPVFYSHVGRNNFRNIAIHLFSILPCRRMINARLSCIPAMPAPIRWKFYAKKK